MTRVRGNTILALNNVGKDVNAMAGDDLDGFKKTLSILNDISLSVCAGDSVAIVGASGSGKSTLLGIMAGLDLPSSGEVELDGIVLNTLTEDERAELRANCVGFVFQSFQLLPGLSALENVMLPLELHGRKDPRQQAEALLDRVGLAGRQNHMPAHLSGGEQQRVAIARAFASQPRILFADEPTGNLDGKTGKMIADLIFELNREEKTTLILVTHDEHLAQRCQRQVVISDGRILRDSDDEEVQGDIQGEVQEESEVSRAALQAEGKV
jgi:putative ABC transport system ATP-binding protein